MSSNNFNHCDEYVQPFQMTYEMYNDDNVIGTQIVNEMRSATQTAASASEKGMAVKTEGDVNRNKYCSYKEYLNAKFNKEYDNGSYWNNGNGSINARIGERNISIDNNKNNNDECGKDSRNKRIDMGEMFPQGEQYAKSEGNGLRFGNADRGKFLLEQQMKMKRFPQEENEMYNQPNISSGFIRQGGMYEGMGYNSNSSNNNLHVIKSTNNEALKPLFDKPMFLNEGGNEVSTGFQTRKEQYGNNNEQGINKINVYNNNNNNNMTSQFGQNELGDNNNNDIQTHLPQQIDKCALSNKANELNENIVIDKAPTFGQNDNINNNNQGQMNQTSRSYEQQYPNQMDMISNSNTNTPPNQINYAHTEPTLSERNRFNLNNMQDNNNNNNLENNQNQMSPYGTQTFFPNENNNIFNRNLSTEPNKNISNTEQFQNSNNSHSNYNNIPSNNKFVYQKGGFGSQGNTNNNNESNSNPSQQRMEGIDNISSIYDTNINSKGFNRRNLSPNANTNQNNIDSGIGLLNADNTSLLKDKYNPNNNNNNINNNNTLQQGEFKYKKLYDTNESPFNKNPQDKLIYNNNNNNNNPYIPSSNPFSTKQQQQQSSLSSPSSLPQQSKLLFDTLPNNNNNTNAFSDPYQKDQPSNKPFYSPFQDTTKHSQMISSMQNPNLSDDALSLNPQYINSLDEISSLPKDEQILLLFNNNKNLARALKNLKFKYDNLKDGYAKLQQQQLNDDITKNKSLKEMLLKENKELKQLNTNFENILEPLVNYVNDVNTSLGKPEIDINQLKRMAREYANNNNSNSNINNGEFNTSSNPNQVAQLKEFLSGCNKDTMKYIQEANKELAKKRKREMANANKAELKGIKEESEQNIKNNNKNKNKFIFGNYNDNNNNNIQGVPFNPGQYGFDYYGDRNINCFACNLGCNNSSRGFSPLICSPNRTKYIKNGKKEFI